MTVARMPDKAAAEGPPTFSPKASPLSRGDLKARTLTALVAVPVVVGLVWAGENATGALVAAAAALGLYEFHSLAARPGSNVTLALGVAGAVLFAVDALLGRTFTLPLVVGAAIAPLLAMTLRPQEERTPADWAWAVAGMLWIGLPLSLAVTLRMGADGREWVLTALLLTFAVDTGAFLVGRAVGRRKMAPSISPGKTWEGAAAGVVAGAVAAMALTSGFQVGIAVWKAALMGVLVALFAQLGDLAESMLKRSAGAKDAGGLLPGHGGILDRLDSLIPAIAVLYFSLEYLGR